MTELSLKIAWSRFIRFLSSIDRSNNVPPAARTVESSVTQQQISLTCKFLAKVVAVTFYCSDLNITTTRTRLSNERFSQQTQYHCLNNFFISMARLNREDRNFTGSLPDLKASVKATEHQTKVVDRKIFVVETHFPKVAAMLQRYAVGTAKLRNKGDELAKTITAYAEEESPSLKQGLTTLSECLSAIQDQRDAEVSRIEGKLVNGFSVYDTKCKQARNDVRVSSSLCTREVKSFESLERAQMKSTDRTRIARAQAEFQKASGEANRSLRVLREQMNEFESQKMRDVKQILSEFVVCEMELLARSMELYTRAYQGLMNISEEDDLEEFNKSMTFKPPQWGSAPVLSNAGRFGNAGNSMDNVLEEVEDESDDLNRTM